jgi:hypothetical protein
MAKHYAARNEQQKAQLPIISGIPSASDDVGLTQVSGSFSKRGKMLKIQRSSNGQVLFTISGQMNEEDIAEIEMLLRSETSDRDIVLDLKDLTLADREAIRFLGRCETEGIALQNCAVYVRDWITRERRVS